MIDIASTVEALDKNHTFRPAVNDGSPAINSKMHGKGLGVPAVKCSLRRAVKQSGKG
jgi:hypothetical protein